MHFIDPLADQWTGELGDVGVGGGKAGVGRLQPTRDTHSLSLLIDFKTQPTAVSTLWVCEELFISHQPRLHCWTQASSARSAKVWIGSVRRCPCQPDQSGKVCKGWDGGAADLLIHAGKIRSTNSPRFGVAAGSCPFCPNQIDKLRPDPQALQGTRSQLGYVPVVQMGSTSSPRYGMAALLVHLSGRDRQVV